MTEQSFREMKAVPSDQLRERLACIRVLEESESQYEALLKDRVTGEHYLHHAHLHLNVAEGGTEEHYHAVMPLEPDDVIEVMVSDRRYVFPDEWQRPFLRNGPEQLLVWFDPQMNVESDPDAQFGAALHERLLAFKQAGQFDPKAMEQLFTDIDQMRGQIDDDRGAAER